MPKTKGFEEFPPLTGGMMYAVSGYNGATRAYGNPLNVLLVFSVDGK